MAKQTKLADIEAAGERATAKGNTPRRNFRVDDDLWNAYVIACEVEGVSVSERLRAHMREVVDKGATE